MKVFNELTQLSKKALEHLMLQMATLIDVVRETGEWVIITEEGVALNFEWIGDVVVASDDSLFLPTPLPKEMAEMLVSSVGKKLKVVSELEYAIHLQLCVAEELQRRDSVVEKVSIDHWESKVAGVETAINLSQALMHLNPAAPCQCEDCIKTTLLN